LTEPSHYARCFGLNWHSDIALDMFDPAAGSKELTHVSIRQVKTLPLRIADICVGRAEIDSNGFRFAWNDEATFDMYGGNRIDCCPGPLWQGKLPDSFFSSVAGLTLAWRGILPLHASTLVIDGTAWLVAGRAGAGKSTLVAELLAGGADLLADDLSAVTADDEGIFAYRGRPAMRLHPASAAITDAAQTQTVPDDPRGKLLVWPKSRASDTRLPIGGALLLGEDAARLIAPSRAAAAFGSMLFRPRICAKLPGQVHRRQALFALAKSVPVYGFPSLQTFGSDARKARVDALMELIEG
jgi:hypothetical protein